jgi:hypothetical protein
MSELKLRRAKAHEEKPSRLAAKALCLSGGYGTAESRALPSSAHADAEAPTPYSVLDLGWRYARAWQIRRRR